MGGHKSVMITAEHFRTVLGHYPTGVCAITAISETGEPFGLIVGSFSSVSLTPPLIGFYPDKASTSWRQIAKVGRFCVNILARDQRELCRQLARPSSTKFDNVSHAHSPNGSPILDGIVAWIDCDVHQVVEAGDHYLVLGAVTAMKPTGIADPMIFFQGRYGGFAAPD